MSRTLSGALPVLLALLLAPATSHAQVRRPQVQASAPTKLMFRGFGDAGLTVFSATKSFKAILGQPVGPLFGGGVELGFNHLFVSVAASRIHRTGDRVFVFQDQIFDLHEPTTINITPLEVNVGYRFLRPARPGVRASRATLIPYLGGGISWHKYSETSPHSTAAEEVHDTFAGYQVLGGAEIPLRNWIGLAAEAQFASVPNALGKNATGVANVYEESDLGGFTFRLKVVVGR